MLQHRMLAVALVVGGLGFAAIGQEGEAGARPQEPRWVIGAEERRKELVRLPSKSERALKDAARWLLRHQEPDGSWSAQGFAARCAKEPACDGPGVEEKDVGVTALAALALMAAGDMRGGEGEERAAVERALRWLAAQQTGEDGLIGGQRGYSFLYGHAIATTALAEGRIVLELPELDEPLRRAVACVLAARNPNGAWRYALPPSGDNDTSVTAWMVSALATARDAGADVDAAAFRDAIRWIDEATDRATGRVGYDSMGSSSSRVPGINDQFPTDRTEAMTAAGMLVRYLCGQDAGLEDFIEKHAQLLMKHLPTWGRDGLTADLYAWYYGSGALHQLGGDLWRAWSKELVEVLDERQDRRGEAKGSWSPEGPWGWCGGRVYSTALAALALAEPVRHRRLADE